MSSIINKEREDRKKPKETIKTYFILLEDAVCTV
jgi:hypothetical protein